MSRQIYNWNKYIKLNDVGDDENEAMNYLEISNNNNMEEVESFFKSNIFLFHLNESNFTSIYDRLYNFKDNYFNVIFINSIPENILENMVLCFKKLKKNGIMIINNYYFSSIDNDIMQSGIDGFLYGYAHKIKQLGTIDKQLFLGGRDPLTPAASLLFN